MHAVIVGHVVVALPYTILVILPLLERLSMSLEEAAHDLGASPWKTFWRVTFPLLMPALVSAFLIAFTLSFDEYAIASFLAGSQVTWPVFLFTQLRVSRTCAELVAVSSVILVISVGWWWRRGRAAALGAPRRHRRRVGIELHGRSRRARGYRVRQADLDDAGVGSRDGGGVRFESLAADSGPPRHVHRDHEELFYILKGDIALLAAPTTSKRDLARSSSCRAVRDAFRPEPVRTLRAPPAGLEPFSGTRCVSVRGQALEARRMSAR